MTDLRAGKPATPDMLVNLAELKRLYYEGKPNLDDPGKRVSFGTSGHRGSSLKGTFTEAHILAIAQAVCDVRKDLGVDGPLFLGMDTHALSAWAHETALRVLAANRPEPFA